MSQIEAATADMALSRPADSRLKICWRAHSYILPSFGLAIIVWCWFVTAGSWHFFQQEDFCGFYDAYARSIIHGHFDVPRSAIGAEAFTFQGKTYGYFGIGPALLRIPLILLFPEMDGLWSRVMILIAAAISLVCAYVLLRMFRGDSPLTNTERLLHSIFIVSAAIGSSVVFLISRSYTYHEALMWSGAFALLFACAIGRYFARPRPGLLLLAGLFSFMSFHCRPTVGAGALLAMTTVAAILILRARIKPDFAQRIFGFAKVVRPFHHALLTVVTVFFTVGIYFGVNYAKFRTFDGVPLRYYDFYHQFPIRMRVTGGKQVHLQNIPTAVATYFGLHGFTFTRQFPWFHLEEEETVIGWPRNDLIEPFSTVPVSMPALTLLAVIGAATLVSATDEKFRRARLAAVTLFAGGGIMLASVGITERYLHDFYPALIVAAAAGVSRIGSNRHLRLVTAVAALLALMSIVLNCSFSLINQRERSEAPVGEVFEYERLQEKLVC